MKFSAPISVALFATGVFSSAIAPSRVGRDAPTVVERDASTVTNILNDVGSDIKKLDTAVKGFDGSDSSPLESAAKTLVSTIKDGKSTVDGSDDLSLADALALQTPVKDLTKTAETLVDDLKSKRDAIQKAGKCETTRGLVGDVGTSSNSLIDSVVSKVPKDAQDIAEGLAADLRKVLKDADAAFTESNCKDSDNGGGEPTAEPTSAEPTAEPTSEPSAEPTEEPSGEPTAEPTAEPSSEPTDSQGPPAPTTTPGSPPPTNGTSPGVPAPTAGAGTLAPAGLLALGFAAALV